MPKSNIETSRLHRSRTIWALLAWEGELRNSRLSELFGVGSMQVSRFISDFREDYPDTIERHKYAWLPRVGVRPPEGLGGLRDYLAIANVPVIRPHWLEDGKLWFFQPDPITFGMLARACKLGLGVRVQYASMSSGRTAPRDLYPHTLVQLGQRWHVRAWCATRMEYRDFNLGRISNPQRLEQSKSAEVPDDAVWRRMLKVRLRPHRDLSEPQQKIIRAEYFGGTMGSVSEVSAALLHYWVNEVRAAVDVTRQKPPDYLLEVHEAKQFADLLFGAQPEPSGKRKAQTT